MILFKKNISLLYNRIYLEKITLNYIPIVTLNFNLNYFYI